MFKRKRVLIAIGAPYIHCPKCDGFGTLLAPKIERVERVDTDDLGPPPTDEYPEVLCDACRGAGVVFSK